jgi:signal transduction histidine kinase
MRVKPLPAPLGDLVIAGVLAATVTIEAATWAPAGRRLAIPAALLCTLPIALRRRSPLVAFVLALAGLTALLGLLPGFDNDSLGLVAVVVLVFYSVGRHARGYEAVIAVVVILGFVVAGLRYDSPPPYDAGDVGFMLMLLGGPWAAGLVLRLRAERESHLRAGHLRLLREQEDREHRAVVAERARIARELHDVVSHGIAVTVLQARGARRLVGLDDAQVRAALDAIVETNTGALGDMRRLLSLLRTPDGAEPEPVDDPQPSLGELASMVESVRSSGVVVDLRVLGPLELAPPGVGLTAYRILQEALTNVMRHAGPAPRAEVVLHLAADELTLSVQDDGADHPTASTDGGGRGLVGIRERVAVVGGTVEAGPVPGGGFRLHARLPYAAEVLPR